MKFVEDLTGISNGYSPKILPTTNNYAFPESKNRKKNIQNVVSLKTATVITRLWVTINALWITRIFEGKNETYRYELRAFSELVSDRTKEENPVITRSVRPGLSFER